jgi:hypothetical protein
MVIFTVLFAVAVSKAKADSFNVTNRLDGGVAMVGYPTNSIGTNVTGGPVSVINQSDTGAGLNFQGQIASGSNGTVTVTLVRSQTANPPTTATATAGALSYNDWETTPSLTVTFGTPLGLYPTNWVNWQTNLQKEWLAPANWIGVYSITNATTNTMIMTNLSITVNKKIIPIRYP